VRTLAPAVAIALVLSACAAGATQVGSSSSASATAPARRVLVLTQTRGYHHASIPTALSALTNVARRAGFDVVPLASASQLDAAELRGVAAVVFLLTSGELPISPAGKHALVAYVRGGGGLLGFHSASDTFHHWPAFIRMLGAEFDHHALPSTGRLIVEDGKAPATAGLGHSLQMFEELYVFKHDPRASSHILVRLDTGRGGPDEPLVWCRREGRGRVFYDALGHFPQTWSDRRQLRLVSGGLAWAAERGPGGGC